jgi:hypothetical protein
MLNIAFARQTLLSFRARRCYRSQHGSPVCGASPGGSWRAWNDAPFTGGQDSQVSPAVEQSDIDGATSSLTASLTPGTQQSVQSQINNNERALGSAHCSSQAQADHAPGDLATSVTVTVTVTCTLATYDSQGALALASHLLHMQARQNPGVNYALADSIVSTVVNAIPASGQSGTINLVVKSEGIWVFQFSDARKQSLQASLAGKHRAAMLSWLGNQPGVKTATIQITGNSSDLLPTNPSQIQITIESIHGLQATP